MPKHDDLLRMTRKLEDPVLADLIGTDETALLNHLCNENMRRNSAAKVFCIGYNKTGTTSMERVLRDLGYKMPRQGLQEQFTNHVLTSGRYDLLKRFVTRFDAFQDVPFSMDHLYIAVDAMFPGSKFILTLRDPNDWFDSLFGFHAKAIGADVLKSAGPEFWRDIEYLHKNYAYEVQRRIATRTENGKTIEDWLSLYDRDTRIRAFNRRNDAIRQYFRHRPGDLLCLDVSAETDTSRVCQFLGFDESAVQAFPHRNARS